MNQQLHYRSPGHASLRRGLAPFEFVIAAPLLIFMMALMVNFATTGAWRIRGEVAARERVFRSRWPRAGMGEPPQPAWDGQAGTDNADPLVELDLPETNHPVVRGPLPNGFVVNDTLDPTQGMRRGWAEKVEPFPMIRSMGSFRVGRVFVPLLDNTFQNARMRIPREYRRSLVIYQLPQTPQQFVDDYLQAIYQALSIPNRAALSVLDRDQDLRIALRGYVNFYPQLRHPYQGVWIVNPTYCERDPNRVYEQWILGPSPGLIDRVDPTAVRPEDQVRFGQISNLPRMLTRVFLGAYERAKREIAQLEERLQTETDPQIRIAIQARLAELYQIQNLEGKIQQLREYQEQLPELEEQLREMSLRDYERYNAQGP